jgi:hypothetical protein
MPQPLCFQNLNSNEGIPMPKYYEGIIELPPDIVVLNHDAVNEEVLNSILADKSGLTTLSIKLPNLPDNSLGYVFIVESKNNIHSLMDIKNVVHFRGISTAYLARIIKHASGIEFDEDVQAEFHRIRNEKGID